MSASWFSDVGKLHSGGPGNPLDKNASYNEIINFCRSSGIPFNVTSTYGGGHAASSYHYRANAIDVASSRGNMDKLGKWLNGYGPYCLELIYGNDSLPGRGYWWKLGEKKDASFYGPQGEDFTHIHVAMTKDSINAAKTHATSGTAVSTVGLSIPGAGDVGSLINLVNSSVAFFKLLSDPHTWVRVGMILAGLLAIGLGAGMIIDGAGTIKSTSDAAAKVSTAVKAVS